MNPIKLEYIYITIYIYNIQFKLIFSFKIFYPSQIINNNNIIH